MEKELDNESQKQPEPTRPPDEIGSFNVEGFLKITDPDSGEVILATRD